MKLIYLIAGTYRPAGMERVLAQKANWWAAHGNEVMIVTTDQRGQKPAFGFNPSIRMVDLGINYEENNGGSFINKLVNYPLKQIRHRSRLSKLLKEEKADIVVSMFCNDASFVPKIKDGSRKVLEIHFSRFKRLQYARKGIWAFADRWRSRGEKRIASRFDRFVVLTDEDRGYWGDMPNIQVIPNPRTFVLLEPAKLENRTVLAVGRYTHQKGFDLLLKAWQSIDTAGWTLRIAGSGESLGEVPDNVITGPSADMKSEYLDSSILVLSSRYEGLPMVLLEAQAAGLPVVAFECKCGPKDVLTDGVDGYLVKEGDIVGFAARMKELMEDVELRKKMGAAAYDNSDKYDQSIIMDKWQKLFLGLL